MAEDILDQNSRLVNFADDTNILIVGSSLSGLLNISSDRLKKAQEWFLQNKLILNNNKTNYLCFRSKRRNNFIPGEVRLCTQDVILAESTKFLGIHIYQNLDWVEHVSSVCKKVNSACYSLRMMAKYLDVDTLKVIYYSNIHSALRFGVIFWGGSTDVQHAFIAQKRAIRIVLSMGWMESCRGRFRQLKILTLPGLYIYECLVFFFKNRHLFLNFEIQHNLNTRNLGLNVPVHKLSMTERGPTYMCITFFNKLPNNLKTEKNFKVFKKSILNAILELEPYSVKDFLEHKF